MIIFLLIIYLVLLVLYINNKLEIKGLNEELAIAFKCIDRNRKCLTELEEQNDITYVEIIGNGKKIIE